MSEIQLKPTTVGESFAALLDDRLESGKRRVGKAKAMYDREKSDYTKNQLDYARNYCSALKDLRASIPKTLHSLPVYDLAVNTICILETLRELEKLGFLSCPIRSICSQLLPNMSWEDIEKLQVAHNS